MVAFVVVLLLSNTVAVKVTQPGLLASPKILLLVDSSLAAGGLAGSRTAGF